MTAHTCFEFTAYGTTRDDLFASIQHRAREFDPFIDLDRATVTLTVRAFVVAGGKAIGYEADVQVIDNDAFYFGRRDFAPAPEGGQ